MTDQEIDKAAAFLLTLRPPRTGVPAALQHAEAVVEIRTHLQVVQALKMAGLASAVSMEQLAAEPAPPADEILTCLEPGCGWVGHEEDRIGLGILGEVYCPVCGGTKFERAAA